MEREVESSVRLRRESLPGNSLRHRLIASTLRLALPPHPHAPLRPQSYARWVLVRIEWCVRREKRERSIRALAKPADPHPSIPHPPHPTLSGSDPADLTITIRPSISTASALAAQIDAWMATARAARAAAATGDAGATVESGAEAAYAASPLLASAPTRALIGPHAGYSYCGHVLAHAYAGVDSEGLRRAIVLGPCHHVYSTSATISGVDAAETPFGPLAVDEEARTALFATGAFGGMTPLGDDEAEHSLELHLPFLAAALGAKQGSPSQILIVPIMVGALSPETEASVADALAPYLADPHTLFVVSSDFCHWGARFGYTRTLPGLGLADGIEALDREGMGLIAAQDGPGWKAYLARTGNTVCGRYPISLLLATLAACEGVEHAVGWVAYDQSSRCVGPRDSSVSYASAVVAVKK